MSSVESPWKSEYDSSLTFIVEWIGYAARTVSAKDSPNGSLSSYIVQVLLILLAPSLFVASVYMMLGRMIMATNGEDLAPISRRWLTKIFVVGDILSFLAQAAGM